MVEHMLSTIDNPWNPFTHFNEWNAWDQHAGYHTLAFLARVVITSDELPDSDQQLAIEEGMDEIVRENVTGVHIKVTPSHHPRVLN